MSDLSSYSTHISAFILGAFLSGLFFSGQLQNPDVIHVSSAKRLAGAVMLASYNEETPLQLVRDDGAFAFEELRAPATTSTSTIFAVATSTTSTTSTEVVNEEIEPTSNKEKEEEPPVVETPPVDIQAIEEVVAEVQSQLEVLEEENVNTEDTNTLPEGVYLLGNGEYVDKNGDKISGDPLLYNYKPPPEEENFTTPGGVVMDRFGNILHTPEVVDESKVLIPPTILDPNEPPSTISPIYVPRYVMIAIHQNPFLTCTQLLLYGNDRALCKLYKESGDAYEWIRVDEIDE